MKKFVFTFIIIAMLSSCNDTDDYTALIPYPILTEAEVTEGLKSALTVGTDTAVSIVSKVNGYFLDELIKIYLPPEASIIVENANSPLLAALGVPELIDDMILKMNRAAEDAAIEATPIFVSAITTMTIEDAFEIFNGSDTSATHYLREKTYADLKNAFQPKIANSLDKPLVGGISASETWTSITEQYNDIANSIAGQLAGLTPVNTQLDEHVTAKALDGLFIKVSDEEKAIRTDPLARVNDILKKVFGN
jgi:predicted nucleic acid-binding protein